MKVGHLKNSVPCFIKVYLDLVECRRALGLEGAPVGLVGGTGHAVHQAEGNLVVLVDAL